MKHFQLNKKTKNKTKKKEKKRFEETLHQRIYMEKHRKRYSTSLVTRKIQIETTIRYYYLSDKMADSKKTDQIKSWGRYETIDTITWENI